MIHLNKKNNNKKEEKKYLRLLIFYTNENFFGDKGIKG